MGWFVALALVAAVGWVAWDEWERIAALKRRRQEAEKPAKFELRKK